jgi:hypothetical protein
MNKWILFFGLLFSFALANAQRTNDLVQFSGIVVTADSLDPVPFTNIAVNNTSRGTTSDYFGFFSIVVHKKDIITFSAVGYKKISYRISDTLSADRYSMIQVMTCDTIMLSETVIYPWPTKEQFRYAFLKLNVPDDDIEIARKNMERMAMKDADRKHRDPDLYAMDGYQNYKNYTTHMADRLYYAGQAPPNNLLNPFAWAKFIEAWKRGDFKRKD